MEPSPNREGTRRTAGRQGNSKMKAAYRLFSAIAVALTCFVSSSLSAAGEDPGQITTGRQISSLVALFDCSSGKEVWRASSVAPTPPIKLAAAGFCELHDRNGTYYCEEGTCTGTCRLNNFPVSCLCT
jgi:hypothetical protein